MTYRQGHGSLPVPFYIKDSAPNALDSTWGFEIYLRDQRYRGLVYLGGWYRPSAQSTILAHRM